MSTVSLTSSASPSSPRAGVDPSSPLLGGEESPRKTAGIGDQGLGEEDFFNPPSSGRGSMRSARSRSAPSSRPASAARSSGSLREALLQDGESQGSMVGRRSGSVTPRRQDRLSVGGGGLFGTPNAGRHASLINFHELHLSVASSHHLMVSGALSPEATNPPTTDLIDEEMDKQSEFIMEEDFNMANVTVPLERLTPSQLVKIDQLRQRIADYEVPVNKYIESLNEIRDKAGMKIGKIPLQLAEDQERRLEETRIVDTVIDTENVRRREEEFNQAMTEAQFSVMSEFNRLEKLRAKSEREYLAQELRRHETFYKEFTRADDRLAVRLEKKGAELHVRDSSSEHRMVDSDEEEVGETQKRLWRAEYKRAPQPVQIHCSVCRAVKEKLIKGRYVLMVSLYDRLGGSPLRWSGMDRSTHRGKLARERFCAATTPMFHGGHFYDIEIRFDQSIFLVCPSPQYMRPSMAFVFELFRLRSPAHPADEVVGWGAFPASSGEFLVAEGRFKTALLKGEMDKTIDRWSQLQRVYRKRLDDWLCNFYFEVVHLPRYSPLQKEFEVELLFRDDLQFNLQSELDDVIRDEKTGKLHHFSTKEILQRNAERHQARREHERALATFRASLASGRARTQRSGATTARTSNMDTSRMHTGRSVNTNMEDQDLENIELDTQALDDLQRQEELEEAQRIEAMVEPLLYNNFPLPVDGMEWDKDLARRWGLFSRYKNVMKEWADRNVAYNIWKKEKEEEMQLQTGNEDEDELSEDSSAMLRDRSDSFVSGMPVHTDEEMSHASDVEMSPQVQVEAAKGKGEDDDDDADGSELAQTWRAAQDEAEEQELQRQRKENPRQSELEASMQRELGTARTSGREALPFSSRKEIASGLATFRNYPTAEKPSLKDHVFRSEGNLEVGAKSKPLALTSGAPSHSAMPTARTARSSAHVQQSFPDFVSQGKVGMSARQGATLRQAMRNQSAKMDEAMSYMDNTTVAASSFIQDVMLDKEDPMEDSCGTFNPSNYHQTVAPPTRNWTKEDVVKQKFTYIRKSLLHDLGFSNPRRMEFWATLLIFLIVFWIRYLPHFLGLWLYLSAFRVSILSSEWTAYYAYFAYSGEFYTPGFEAGSAVIGTLFLEGFFFFLVLLSWAAQRLLGRFSTYWSRILFALGVATILDPFLIALVDVAVGNMRNGDAFRLYHYYLITEGNGIVGVFLTVFLNAIAILFAVLVLYQYSLTFHMNGRMMDVYNRLHALDHQFYMPHDLEISKAELQEKVEKAMLWRGESGSLRKTHVVLYKEDEISMFLSRLHLLLTSRWPSNYVESCPLVGLEINDDVKNHARQFMPSFAERERKRILTEEDVRDVLFAYLVHRSMTDDRDRQKKMEVEREKSGMRRRKRRNQADEEDDEDDEFGGGAVGILMASKPAKWISQEVARLRGIGTGAILNDRELDQDQTEESVEDGDGVPKGLFEIRNEQLLADALFFEVEGKQNRVKKLHATLKLYNFIEHRDMGGFSSNGEGAAVMYHQKTNKFVPMDARGSVSLLPRSGLSRRQAEKVAFHVVIFSQDYETLERELFRHFIRGPDGTIAEVFTEEDMTSPENYHKSLTEWSPQNIDYWMHRVAPNMMEELKAAADEVDDIMPLEQVELDGIESELSHSDDEYSFVN